MHPMLGRSSGRLGFKPDTKEKTKTSHKQKSKKVSGENKVFTTSCRFRMTTPLRFLRCIGEKVATALHYLSFRRRRRSSPNVCSSGRSNPSIAPLDAYRAEAINDCIEFINKSSSFQRTKSVPPKVFKEKLKTTEMVIGGVGIYHAASDDVLVYKGGTQLDREDQQWQKNGKNDWHNNFSFVPSRTDKPGCLIGK